MCSTAAPHPVVTQQSHQRRHAGTAQSAAALTLIDIAVPRDVEASVDELDNVYLLQHRPPAVVCRGRTPSALRRRSARAREIVDRTAMLRIRALAAAGWKSRRSSSPCARKLEAVRLGELARLRSRKLPGLSEKEWKLRSKPPCRRSPTRSPIPRRSPSKSSAGHGWDGTADLDVDPARVTAWTKAAIATPDPGGRRRALGFLHAHSGGTRGAGRTVGGNDGHMTYACQLRSGCSRFSAAATYLIASPSDTAPICCCATSRAGATSGRAAAWAAVAAADGRDRRALRRGPGKRRSRHRRKRWRRPPGPSPWLYLTSWRCC